MGFRFVPLVTIILSVAGSIVIFCFNPDYDQQSLVQTAPAAPMGTLKLRVIDASTGKTTPARLGIYNEKGQFQYPNENALRLNLFDRTDYMYRLRFDFTWPTKNRYVFYTTGQYECELAAGTYELVAKKGLEYRRAHETVTIEGGQTLEYTLRLDRWTDMAGRNWYSGDTHIHVRREPADNPLIMAQMQADDVNVANLLQVGDITKYYMRQYAFGEKGKYQEGNYALIGSQEDPRTPHCGHVVFLNMTSMFHDDETYFLYHKAFEEVRRQGGLGGYAHFGLLNLENRGMALDVPFNLVDFLEIIQRDKCDPSIWYEFLNLGYKLIPTAGSDFPYVGAPGDVRNYVYIDGPFSTQAWFKSLAAGRTFVTNGPILTFTVNGQQMGSELTVKPGESLNIKATATINPDIDELARLKLIVHGETVHQVEASRGAEHLELNHTLKTDHGMWMAIQADGKGKAVAHTAPVYVIVDGQPFWEPALVPELVARQRQRMQELLNKPVKTIHEHYLLNDLRKQWAEQKPLVERRVQKANTKYDKLLKALPTD